MNKEKALKNQGSKFREVISGEGGCFKSGRRKGEDERTAPAGDWGEK